MTITDATVGTFSNIRDDTATGIGSGTIVLKGAASLSGSNCTEWINFTLMGNSMLSVPNFLTVTGGIGKINIDCFAATAHLTTYNGSEIQQTINAGKITVKDATVSPSDLIIVTQSGGSTVSLPVPTLMITRAGDDVTLSWPGIAIGFDLEMTDNLSPAIQWTPVGETPQLIDNEFQVTVPISSSQMFYHLIEMSGCE